MKLKLRTQSTETLKTCLSQISNVRKFVVLRFSPEQLLAILINGSSINQEPQVWCKLRMLSIFSEIEIQSLRDNVILLEINIELLLQTLRNFDKANSHDLSIRLQRKESSGGTTGGGSRTASLALYYSDVTVNGSTINHTFRIPVKILKGNSEMLQEPELPRVDLMMRLPNEFSATYKRLDKFKKSLPGDLVTIQASRRHGGYLGFVLQEDGKFKVTIRWNDKLDVQKPQAGLDSDSLRAAALNDSTDEVDESDESEDKEITVRLKDWKMAAKIVSTCKTIIFLMCHNEACVIHCLLDDSDDVEMIYYIGGVRIREGDEY
ncbi:CIC11C00000002171 [Sungouiella intermedia]|uniref:Checkpoint protein n=1 Tax=Sungouiella intermedia TaxID=45354 RepID=A0A1L0DP57_9ASCO|nr:CIC11C00000001383 [[Candida] intermedia]SGZ54150.1 CIC11C00000002171 [[Candida] intermedia]